MKPEDLPSQFDGLPADIREMLAAFGEQGFEDAAAAISVVTQEEDISASGDLSMWVL